jgi:hypothetical protein
VRINYSGSTLRGAATIDVDTIVGALQPLLKTLQQARAGFVSPGDIAKSPALNPFARPEPNGRTPNSPGPRPGGPIEPGPRASASEMARRMQSSNDLRQIGIALHSAADKDGYFPAAAICDARGNPLLSWRVAILPYLGEEELYKQFHLDEPWDSPNNKALQKRMPAVFKGRYGGLFRTHYLAVAGQKYAFFGCQGRAIADFTDGLSQTILIVESAPTKSVIWTKPEELEFKAADPRSGLFGVRDAGFLALFGDGHVDSIPSATSDDVLRALFTIAGGETIPAHYGAP